MRSGKKNFVVVLVAFVAMMAAACVPEATSSGASVGADCTTPPTIAPGALLSGCSMIGFDLSGLDLSGADLRGANLTGANLANSDLSGADLTGANLTNANLTGADLTGAVLAGSILLGALFIGAILTGTDLGFGQVFGKSGNGGSNQGSNASCTGPYCPGYNEVEAPRGPGRVICEPVVTLPEDDHGDDDVVFVVASTELLTEHGARSVVTDEWTSFRGATFDYSEEDGGSAALLLNGLDLRKADFTDATFIDTDLACKNADGARFSGTRFVPTTSSGVGMGGLFHVSAREADFTGAEMLNMYFCDVDLTGATMVDLAIGGASFISCPEMLTAEEFNDLPADLVVFDGADMRGATFGVVPNPSPTLPAFVPGMTTTVLTIAGDVQTAGSEPKTSRFHGTVLDGAHFEGVMMTGADFTDASADGVVVTTPVQRHNWFDGVVFGSGWTNTTWSGSIDFEGALCPDGSTGGQTNHCFVVMP